MALINRPTWFTTLIVCPRCAASNEDVASKSSATKSPVGCRRSGQLLAHASGDTWSEDRPAPRPGVDAADDLLLAISIFSLSSHSPPSGRAACTWRSCPPWDNPHQTPTATSPANTGTTPTTLWGVIGQDPRMFDPSRTLQLPDTIVGRVVFDVDREGALMSSAG
jgi:hypothetical protein